MESKTELKWLLFEVSLLNVIRITDSRLPQRASLFGQSPISWVILNGCSAPVGPRGLSSDEYFEPKLGAANQTHENFL